MAIGHLPQQAVGPGKFEDGAAGRGGVEEIGHRATEVVEAIAAFGPSVMAFQQSISP